MEMNTWAYEFIMIRLKFSVTYSLMIDFDQHLAIPTNASGPTIPERTPKDEISLPVILVCPGTRKRRSLLRSASLPSASLHPPTSHEWVTGTASALRTAWLSEQILMYLPSVLRSSNLCAQPIIAMTSV